MIWIIPVRNHQGYWSKNVLFPANYFITDWLESHSWEPDFLSMNPGSCIIRMAPSPMWGGRKGRHYTLALPCAKRHILGMVWLAMRYFLLVCSSSGSPSSSLSLLLFLMCFFKQRWALGTRLFPFLISWLSKPLCWMLVCFEECWFLQGLFCSHVTPCNYLVFFSYAFFFLPK